MIASKENLIAHIKVAFENSLYPGDNNLFVDVYDPDIVSFDKILRGNHWMETLDILTSLEGSDFYFYHSMFSFMTVAALYYYTPTFLIISMDEKADKVADYFFYHLDTTQRDQTQFRELIQEYSAPQKQMIASTLKYCYGDGDDSLNGYWSQWISTVLPEAGTSDPNS